MSDIQILLSEILDKLTDMENRIKKLDEKIDRQKQPQMIWGDDSIPLPLNERLEIKDPVPNPYEITCKGEN